MGINLIKIDAPKDYDRINILFHAEFTGHGKTALRKLIQKSKSRNIAFYSVYDDKIWIGFIYLIFKNDLLLIQYFAIDSNNRSKGYGGEVIKKIKEIYSGYRIILGIEKYEEKAKNNEQRIKRKKFYEKHGFKESGYIVKQYGILNEILIYGDTFLLEEFDPLMEIYSGKIVWSIKKLFHKKVSKNGFCH
jgi:GNAT superfamily N-acetyltransferase